MQSIDPSTVGPDRASLSTVGPDRACLGTNRVAPGYMSRNVATPETFCDKIQGSWLTYHALQVQWLGTMPTTCINPISERTMQVNQLNPIHDQLKERAVNQTAFVLPVIGEKMECNGATLLDIKSESFHEGDTYLFIVLAKYRDEFVTWNYNAHNEGCGGGHYFSDNQEKAEVEFRNRHRRIRKCLDTGGFTYGYPKNRVEV